METQQLLAQLEELQNKTQAARTERASLQTDSNRLLWACCPTEDEQAWRDLSIRHMQLDDQLGQLERSLKQIISQIEPQSVSVKVQAVAW